MMFDNLPVILSLLAGLIVSVAMLIYQYDAVTWMLIVLGTLIVFYIFGACLKKFYKVILAEPKVEIVAESEQIESEEETETEE